MKELFLVRHGEAEHLVDGSGGGWIDTPLTELGRRQSHCIARVIFELVKERSVNLWSSDLARAVETASIIGDYLEVEPNTSELIRGLSLGEAGELKKKEAHKIRNPITLPLFDWIPYPGAESLNIMQKRVNQFMEFNYSNHDGTTIIVAHGNSCTAILYWWFGFRREILTSIHKPSFFLEPCSLTHLYISGHKRAIKKLNDTAHLE